MYCDDKGWACQPVLDWTGNEQLAATVGWLSVKPLQIMAILLVALVANQILRHLIERAGTRVFDGADRVGGLVPASVAERPDTGRTAARSATMSSISRSIATSIVALVATAAILSALGVSLAALIASAGVVGVALGFGAQNLVRDVLAGWFILVEDRYGVGDTIDAGAPAVGVVERITLRSTRLRDVNGTVWHVANGEIVRVGNKSQNWSRAVVDVVVPPGADIDRACAVLSSVATEMAEDPEWSERLTAPPDVLGVHLMDPTGVTLRVLCETEPASQFAVERDFRRRVLRSFDAEGITLAAAAMVRPVGGSAEGPPTS